MLIIDNVFLHIYRENCRNIVTFTGFNIIYQRISLSLSILSLFLILLMYQAIIFGSHLEVTGLELVPFKVSRKRGRATFQCLIDYC